MGVKIAPDARRQFLNASGVPYSGAKLFYYAAGSTTKQNTYTTSAGSVANSNPIVLDSAGRTPYGVWFTEGLTYKEVLAPSTDTDPPSSPIFTEDNLSGINDTSVTVSQWEASQLTPTYVSTTSFTVPGDQTSNLHVGRRLKFSVTAGTVYGRISASVYGALTTVTVVMDSGQALDSGLSSVSWSILTATNPSIPKISGTAWDGVGVVNNDSAQTVAGVKTFTGANVHSGVNTFSGNNTHSGNNTLSGTNTFSGNNTFSGVSTHTGNIVMSGKPVIFDRVNISAPTATTTNIWTANAAHLAGSATVFTDFADAPQAGAIVDLYCETAHTFTNNANLLVDGGVTYVATVGDRIRVRAITTTYFSLEIIRLVTHPGIAKAWVCFNDTGVLSVLSSYNVTSVTDNGTGDYTVNFTTPLRARAAA